MNEGGAGADLNRVIVSGLQCIISIFSPFNLTFLRGEWDSGCGRHQHGRGGGRGGGRGDEEWLVKECCVIRVLVWSIFLPPHSPLSSIYPVSLLPFIHFSALLCQQLRLPISTLSHWLAFTVPSVFLATCLTLNPIMAIKTRIVHLMHGPHRRSPNYFGEPPPKYSVSF